MHEESALLQELALYAGEHKVHGPNREEHSAQPRPETSAKQRSLSWTQHIYTSTAVYWHRRRIRLALGANIPTKKGPTQFLLVVPIAVSARHGWSGEKASETCEGPQPRMCTQSAPNVQGAPEADSTVRGVIDGTTCKSQPDGVHCTQDSLHEWRPFFSDGE